ncbi:hypothetical protein B7463_g6611, partial [Scytalidium lignicola]
MSPTIRPTWSSSRRKTTLSNEQSSSSSAQKLGRRLFSRSTSISTALSRVMPHRQYKSYDHSTTYKDHDPPRLGGQIKNRPAYLNNLEETAPRTSEKLKSRRLWNRASDLPPRRNNSQLQGSDATGGSNELQISIRKRHSIRQQFISLWKPGKETDRIGESSKLSKNEKAIESQSSSEIPPKVKIISSGSLDIENHLRKRRHSRITLENEEGGLEDPCHHSPDTLVIDCYSTSTNSFRDSSSPSSHDIPINPTPKAGTKPKEGTILVAEKQQHHQSSLKRRIDIKRLRNWREKRKSEKTEKRELEMELEQRGLGGIDLAELERSIRSQSDPVLSIPSITSFTVNESILTNHHVPYPPITGSAFPTKKTDIIPQESFITPRSSSLMAPSFSNNQYSIIQKTRPDSVIQRKPVGSPASERRVSSLEALQSKRPAQDSQAAAPLKRSRLKATKNNGLNQRRERLADIQSLGRNHLLDISPTFSDPGTPNWTQSTDNQPIRRRHSEYVRSPRPKGPRPLPIARLPKITNTGKEPPRLMDGTETPVLYTTTTSFITPQSSDIYHESPGDIFKDTEKHNSLTGKSYDTVVQEQELSKLGGDRDIVDPRPSRRLFRMSSRANGKGGQRLSRFPTTYLSRSNTPILTAQEGDIPGIGGREESSNGEATTSGSATLISDQSSEVFRDQPSSLVASYVTLDQAVVEKNADINENDAGELLQRTPSSAPVAEGGNIQEPAHNEDTYLTVCLFLKAFLDPKSGFEAVWTHSGIGWENIFFPLLVAVVIIGWLMMLVVIGRMPGCAIVSLGTIFIYMVGLRR